MEGMIDAYIALMWFFGRMWASAPTRETVVPHASLLHKGAVGLQTTE